MNPTSKFLLVEPKTKAIAPNIALMKFARLFELQGSEYQYVRGIVYPKIKPDEILISCIFSYNSRLYEETINHYLRLFPNAKVTVGGVFPSLNPKWFQKWDGAVKVHKGLCPEIEKIPPKYDVNIQSEDENPYARDKLVLYASRGCNSGCKYCCVPKLEGKLKPYKSIADMLNSANMPYATSCILYDNHFNSNPYFDTIVDELIEFNLPCDIHGIHVDSFTRHQAKRFSELKWAAQQDGGISYLRFSFDKLKYADGIHKALRWVTDYDVKASFFCYLLWNWRDSPSDFFLRIQIAQKIVDDVGETIYLFPQRYEPLNALERNRYIGKHWNADLVRGITRLYTQIHGFIPITRSRNIYEWIGHTKEEFLENALKMGTDDNFKLRKKPLIRSDEGAEIKFHPVASIFPLMEKIEFESLTADIQKHGQLEPIWTHGGKIIDGRNRYLACQELGIEPRIKEWKPVNGAELVDFIISLNLTRRHLTPSQKALVAVDSLPFYEEAAKNRMKLSQGRGKKGVAKMPDLNFGRSRDVVASAFGVSGRYIGYAKQINTTDPDLAQEIRDGKKTITEAIKIIKRDEGNPTQRKKYKFSNDIGLVKSDFYEWSQQHLKEDSIDLVMTEPQCKDADIFFWERLAEVAERILKPSGFLVAYCGQKLFDRIVGVLSKHLRYHWMYCVGGNGSRNSVQNGLIENWQPVLAYFKPPFNKDRISKATNLDRQQPDMGISYFMDMLSMPDDLVFDPMVGDGIVLKTSKSLNRRAIGIESNDHISN
jgi:hypothetical protein